MKLERIPLSTCVVLLTGCLYEPVPMTTNTSTGEQTSTPTEDTDSSAGPPPTDDTAGTTGPDDGTETTDTGAETADDTGGCVPDGAPESCDGIDNDCDGVVDPPDSIGCMAMYGDGDGDGYGDEQAAACVCEATSEHPVSVGGDCDDGDAAINPGAPESCNGIDDDCSGQPDDVWPDLGDSCDGADDDQCNDGTIVCTADGSGSTCDDGPQTTNGEELCNGADDDCNGVTDDPWAAQLGNACDGGDADQCANGVYVCSADGSGVECSGDMNVLEICNGIDDDCDGQLDEGCDDDGDDHCDAGMMVVGNPAVCDPALGDDCDDGDAGINPSADEVCNGADDDCDGQLDAADPDTDWAGNDGYEPNSAIFPPPPEIFENNDPAVPFGPSPTWFGSANDLDYFLWDDTFNGFPPTFMMCHISGMTAPMRVDLDLGYRRNVDPALPYLFNDTTCTNMANGDTCILGVSPSVSPGEYQFTVGVIPNLGIDQCNDDYVLECRLDYVNMW